MYAQRILKYESFICDNCREYSYSEELGDREQEVKPGTLVDNLPDEWQCPNCGASKEKLLPVLVLGWP